MKPRPRGANHQPYMDKVLSQVTHQPAELIRTIPTDMIIDLYKQDTDIDISEYFKGLPEIYVYRCRQTGYRFYYPFTLAGNDKFYEQLQKFDWYYLQWKWDYDAAIPFIPNGSRVLDIGCGAGNFLIRLKNDKNCDCTGLEFNDKAISAGRAKGLEIHKAFIQDYAKEHRAEYDVVCFFQVLEHIAEIDSFISAALECLKPGGKMIICVPNNNPYYFKYDEFHSLNMPPHHMSLWNEDAFRGLERIYPVRLKAIETEKLTRFRYFTQLHINHAARGNAIKKALMNASKLFITGYFVLNKKNIDAGSILAVYEKKP